MLALVLYIIMTAYLVIEVYLQPPGPPRRFLKSERPQLQALSYIVVGILFLVFVVLDSPVPGSLQFMAIFALIGLGFPQAFADALVIKLNREGFPGIL